MLFSEVFLAANTRQLARFAREQFMQPNIQNNIVECICLDDGANPLGCPTFFTVGTVQQWITKKVTKTNKRWLFSKSDQSKKNNCTGKHINYYKVP